MIEKSKIKEIAERILGDGELFIVDLTVSVAGDIELTIDSDSRVSIDECVRISKAIDGELEASGEEDFSLIVSSAGIGNPLKVFRQFKKCVGKRVDVICKDGRKRNADLEAADESSVTLFYEEKVAVEGKKRKELVEKHEKIDLNEIKSVCETLTIK